MKRLLCVVFMAAFTLSMTTLGAEAKSNLKDEQKYVTEEMENAEGTNVTIEFDGINTLETNKVEVQAGQKIKIKVNLKRGILGIKIQKDEEEPIYEENTILTSKESSVKVKEAGTYTITVEGKLAKGSIDITI